MRDLDIADIDKLKQLNQIKMLATLILLACFLVLVATKILEQHYPALGIIAAFAEAATIGGIADWYAVVALFKRPLNLPFPHTAIIASNQHRIADNLGRFIGTNFLARGPVEQKLREVDFAGEMSNWLSDRDRAHSLAGFVVKFVPQLLHTVDEQGLVRFATQRVTGQIARTDVAPLIGNVMLTFTQDGRHQKLLDDLINALHRFLNDDTTLSVMHQKVKDELPVLFSVVGADVTILNRILAATSDLLEDVKQDRAHPLRAEFEDFLVAYVKRTRRSKAFARQVEEIKTLVLTRPELDQAVDDLWSGVKAFVQRDAEAEDSQLVARLTDMFVDVGISLRDEPQLRRDINDGMVLVLSNLVEDQREAISAYVADQVKTWDIAQLLTLIEVNVGRDLQYIRFNGMIIGGVVGVCLYGLETLFLS